MMAKTQLLPAPVWDAERLKADLKKAIAIFRDERMREPLDVYVDKFEECKDAFDELLEETVDLSQLRDRALEILGDAKLQEALRYLASPPMSKDDLETLADASLSLHSLRGNADMTDRVIGTVLAGLDRRRFPWVSEGREALEAERNAAVLASAVLIASQRVETERRNASKVQEEQVKDALRQAGFVQAKKRKVLTLDQAPQSGEFCGESMFGGRKADLLVRLWDGRVMAIECKVSNSSTNSIKRVNNDAAVKATVWLKKFGTEGVVPAAVLSGVYKLKNLEDAQSGGLGIFWAHDLQALVDWIEKTRQA